MSEIKTIEQAADEYTSRAYFNLEYSISGTTARECNKAFIAGAKHQKELSDAREKLLIDVISEMKAAFGYIVMASQKSEESYSLNIYYTANDTLSSVAKKLEGL